MKLIQPKPDHSSPLKAAKQDKVQCEVPVSMVRYRYRHHSAPSGYDRICDYLDADEISLSDSLYWAGETVLRPWALWVARTCGVFEHSRYDCIMEQAVIRHANRFKPRIYHFVYGEKSYLRSGKPLSRLGHRIMLTVHHPEGNIRKYFNNFNHLQHVSCILTMDHAMIPKWNEYAGRDIACWIPHGVDCDYFRPVNREEKTVKSIVFAGTHARDIDTLIKVVGNLASDPGLKFHFLSRDPQVLSLSKSYRSVKVTPWLDDDGYRRLLEEADLLLLPLTMSTVCNVVLEALACGAPVVTTHGGIGAYLDPRCSAMLEPGDMESWCAAVKDLLARGTDARLHAREQALKFHWTEIANMHVKIYRELMKE